MQIDRPIAIALTLFAILLLVFFLAVPEYKIFKDLQLQLGEKQAEYVAQFDYYAAITKTFLEIEKNQKDIKKIDAALPQDSTLGETFHYLQNAAQESGLVVKSLFLSKSSGGATESGVVTGKIKKLSFSMDLLGDYASLQNFIISLERSARLFEITNISFSSVSKPPYNFTIQINTNSY